MASSLESPPDLPNLLNRLPAAPETGRFVRHHVVRSRRLQRWVAVAAVGFFVLAAFGGLWMIFAMTRGVFPYR